MNVTVVVPTIREPSIKKFIEKWYPRELGVARTIIIEDNPTKTFKLDIEANRNYMMLEHYSWEDIDKDLGDKSWIISRRTSAIRNYGFLKALEEPCDMIVTLDDDCYPDDKEFLKNHYENLTVPTHSLRWVSTGMNNEPVRGIPYKNKYSDVSVMVSLGLWRHIPDFDAIHQLAGFDEFEAKDGLIPPKMYFSLCSGNFAFKPEATFLLFQSLTGQRNDGFKYPYNRFEDIWAGIMCKKICDHLDWHIHSGKPLIWHDKASDPFVNLQKEVPGIIANEKVWEYIDKIKLTEDTADGCYLEMANHFLTKPLGGDDYWKAQGRAMEIWVDEVKRRLNG